MTQRLEPTFRRFDRLAACREFLDFLSKRVLAAARVRQPPARESRRGKHQSLADQT